MGFGVWGLGFGVSLFGVKGVDRLLCADRECRRYARVETSTEGQREREQERERERESNTSVSEDANDRDVSS